MEDARRRDQGCGGIILQELREALERTFEHHGTVVDIPYGYGLSRPAPVGGLEPNEETIVVEWIWRYSGGRRDAPRLRSWFGGRRELLWLELMTSPLLFCRP